MPSIVQLLHVTSPSAVTWYLCITSHLTFLALHAAHAFAALLLTGFGFPFSSTAADCEFLFLVDCEVSWWAGGDCEDEGEGECISVSVVVGKLRSMAEGILYISQDSPCFQLRQSYGKCEQRSRSRNKIENLFFVFFREHGWLHTCACIDVVCMWSSLCMELSRRSVPSSAIAPYSQFVTTPDPV